MHLQLRTYEKNHQPLSIFNKNNSNFLISSNCPPNDICHQFCFLEQEFGQCSVGCCFVPLVFFKCRKLLSHYPSSSLLLLEENWQQVPCSEFVSLWCCLPCHLTSCISYKLGVRSKGIFKFRLNILGSNRSQTMLLPSIPHLGKGMNLAIYKQLFFFFFKYKEEIAWSMFGN